jgi:putative transposase
MIHHIRNSWRDVASKHQKAFMADLKPVYRADIQQAAEMALDELEAKWGDKYEKVIRSWREKWHLLSTYFKYPEANVYHQSGCSSTSPLQKTDQN